MIIEEFNERMKRKDYNFVKPKEVTFLFYDDDDELKMCDSHPITIDLNDNFMKYVNESEKVHHIKIEAISDVVKFSRSGEVKLIVTCYEKQKVIKKLTIDDLLDQGYTLRQIQQLLKGEN